MLNALRKGAKSWVAKLLLGLLVLSFAVWGIGDIFSFRAGTAVATVGDQEVTAEDYADALARQQTRLSQRAGRAVTYAEIRQSGIDRQVLGQLIQDAALRAELARLGISAPDRAVAEEIRRNEAFLGPGGNFSDQAYRLLLAQQNMTPQEFERITRDLVAQDIVIGAVAGTEATAPGYATRIAAWRGETRKLRLLTLGPALAEDPGAPTEEELAAFYEENKERFREPERRYGRYLHVDVDAIAEAIRAELTEEEVRNAYDAEAASYVTEATRTVDQITFPSLEEAEAAAARLEAGEVDFDALAEEMGQAGPDLTLGEVRPGDLPEASDAAIFALEEPGVTGAVPTTLGGAILRVTEATEGSAVPLEEVRDEIERRLARDKAAYRAPELANEVEELRAAGTALEEIAEEAGPGVVFGSYEGLGPNGTLADGSRATGVLTDPDAAAEIAEALDKEERDFVELGDGSYFLTMVDRVEESRIPELSEIRERVAAAWRERQIAEALAARAERIAKGIEKGTGATLGTTAAGLGLAARETGFFSRNTPPEGVPRALAEAAFAAKEGAVVSAPATDGPGVVLAEVIDVEPMPAEGLEQMSGQIEQALAESLSRDRQNLFVRAVESHHGAEINPQAIEEVFTLLGGSRG